MTHDRENPGPEPTPRITALGAIQGTGGRGARMGGGPRSLSQVPTPCEIGRRKCVVRVSADMHQASHGQLHGQTGDSGQQTWQDAASTVTSWAIVRPVMVTVSV